MFDNLREDSPAPLEDDVEDLFPEEEIPSPGEPAPRLPEPKFLGMTAMQRFIIALMLMIAICTLGTMCLVLTGRISLF